MLMALLCASAASQVQPISTASGGSGGARGPDGQAQYSRFAKRVDPTMRPSASRVVAKGTAAPLSRKASAVSTYLRIASAPSGTMVRR